jgi:signal transduction histidine kinase
MLGDPARVEQILLNLLSNAIKFTDRGHVLLRITAGHLDESQFELYFEIVDTGAGIETTKIAELFQPFTQSDSTKSCRLGGTGLGMAISKELIKLMAARSRFTAKPGAARKWYFLCWLVIALTACREMLVLFVISAGCYYIINRKWQPF